jgi:uncharacterized protein (DUF433 family)
MQKSVRIFSILALLVILFSSVGPVYAQDVTASEDHPERPLRDYVTAAFAAALNLDILDVQNRLDAGESYREIASSQGVEGREFLSMMAEVLAETVNEAIRDGVITAEEAERIRERCQKRREFLRRRLKRRIGRAVLERMGIMREELAEILESGMTWTEILESLGIDIQQPNAGEGFLDAFGLSCEEIRERLAEGETLREIFTSEGIDFSSGVE